MTDKTLQLTIVTQEKKVLETEVKIVTIDTQSGQITILPDHIPLFTKLVTGELKYQTTDDQQHFYAIAGGFLEVGVNNKITILTEAALRADDINEALVEQARQEAEKTMSEKSSRRDFMLAEASLKKALNELNIARKRKRGSN